MMLLACLAAHQREMVKKEMTSNAEERNVRHLDTLFFPSMLFSSFWVLLLWLWPCGC